MGEWISFVPDVSFRDGEISLYGRATPGAGWADGPKIGAVIRHDTGCAHCGKPFVKGHCITADLAPNMAGVARHTDCDDPKLEHQE